MADTLVEVKHLKQYFDISTGAFSTKPLKAVDDVSFSIHRGETLLAARSCTCISPPPVRSSSTARRSKPRRTFWTTGGSPQWFSRIPIPH